MEPLVNTQKWYGVYWLETIICKLWISVENESSKAWYHYMMHSCKWTENFSRAWAHAKDSVYEHKQFSDTKVRMTDCEMGLNYFLLPNILYGYKRAAIIHTHVKEASMIFLVDQYEVSNRLDLGVLRRVCFNLLLYLVFRSCWNSLSRLYTI